MAIPLTPVVMAHRREALRLNQQITDNELAKVLRDGARDASQMAREIGEMSSGIGASTRAAQLRIATQSAEEISDKLWNNAENITRDGIFRSVDMATRQSMDIDRVTGMPSTFLRGYEEGLLTSGRRTAETIIARRQFGYTLSERVYRNGQQTIGRLHRTIESGLVRNLSARELAKEVRGLVDPSTPGGASYSAMRLARTEINNAHHLAYRNHMESRPWINEVEWLLSGSHPHPDVCDEIAADGPYKTDEVPDKPHPQCLCYTVPVLPNQDDFIDSLFEGEYNDWLEDNSMERIVCNSSCSVEDDGTRYQRWDTIEEQEAFLEGLYDTASSSIEEDELDLIGNYVADPKLYNGPLRGMTQGENWSDEIIQRRIREADLIADALNEAVIDRDIIGYRGVGNDLVEKLAEGGQFTDSGFASVSLNEQVAEGFARSASSKPASLDDLFKFSGPDLDSKGYIMEIEIPRGSRGFPIPGRSMGEPEQEIILQKGSTFSITKIDHVAKRLILRLVN